MSREKWDAALAEYLRLRALSDASTAKDVTVLQSGEHACDAAADAYCTAMDPLMLGIIPPPDLDALSLKIDFLAMRHIGFCVTDEIWDDLRSDVRRFADEAKA